MKVNISKTAIVIRKNITTEFFKDKFKNNFIIVPYKIEKKNQLILVRLLGFEPRTSWSVAKRSIQLSYRRNKFLNIVKNNIIFKIFNKV
tara:strand:- start:52 stop:318 length:267 start_codon:yes stop_codon:yes gene_type:complete